MSASLEVESQSSIGTTVEIPTPMGPNVELSTSIECKEHQKLDEEFGKSQLDTTPTIEELSTSEIKNLTTPIEIRQGHEKLEFA